MIIIVKGSRKNLVKKQKACIDYVNKKSNPMDSKTQEAVQDFQRWTNESGVFKNRTGDRHIVSYEQKEVKGKKEIKEAKK